MTTAHPHLPAEILQLRSQVATLEQLIEVHEQVAAEQNRNLERTLGTARSQSRLLQSVLDSIADGVVVADAQGAIVQFNPAAARLCGDGLALGAAVSQLRWPGFRRLDERSFQPGEFPLALALQGAAVEALEVIVRQEGWPQELWLTLEAQPLVDERGLRSGGMLVMHDVTPQRQAEAERRANQEQVIAAQAAALRELSTPLIPVADDVLVMPLVGAIDSRRAEQVLTALLEGVSAHQANTVILDVTGVSIIDTQVASALTSAAQAVRLLGAKVIMTGIKPEVAQTVVGLGVDLSGISTRGTLQTGIAEALRHSSERARGKRR